MKSISAVSVRAQELRKLHPELASSKQPLADWVRLGNGLHHYVGRACGRVKGATHSKFANPYFSTGSASNGLYEAHVRKPVQKKDGSSSSLLQSAVATFGACVGHVKLGCFCPASAIAEGRCHAAVLARLVRGELQAQGTSRKRPQAQAPGGEPVRKAAKVDTPAAPSKVVDIHDSDSESSSNDSSSVVAVEVPKPGPKRVALPKPPVVAVSAASHSKDTLVNLEVPGCAAGTTGQVRWVPHFLSGSEAAVLFEAARGQAKWEQGSYNMYGREVKTPRLLSTMSDGGERVGNKHAERCLASWLPEVEKVRDRLSEFLGVPLTYAQLKLYRNGNDYIGWHTDSELAEGDLIASISLGQTRRFCFRHKGYKQRSDVRRYEFQLNAGALLVMDCAAAKHHWKHCLAKQPKVEGERINVTFRVK